MAPPKVTAPSGRYFAIPINSVERIADQLVTTGRVEHPYLGIRMVSLNDQTRARLGDQSSQDIPEGDGVLVVEVVPGSPVTRARLQAGDVLVAVNDTPVAEAQDVQAQVEASTIGIDLAIFLLRDGRNQTLTVQPAPASSVQRSLHTQLTSDPAELLRKLHFFYAGINKPKTALPLGYHATKGLYSPIPAKTIECLQPALAALSSRLLAFSGVWHGEW